MLSAHTWVGDPARSKKVRNPATAKDGMILKLLPIDIPGYARVLRLIAST